MGFLSNKICIDEVKAGDHIYSWRQAYVYAHHGIYVGDGQVNHFTRGDGQETGTGTFFDKIIVSSAPNHRDTPCPNCGERSNLGGVVSSCLHCFLAGGDLYVFEYNVSPAIFLAKLRGGTCTIAPSDPTEEVVRRSNFLLRNGFGVYNVFKNNCEDFAIYCKTGLLVANTDVGRSGQAATMVAAASVVMSSPLRFVAGFSGLAVAGYSMYCAGRLVSDIGMRWDVSKVPVERLVADMDDMAGMEIKPDEKKTS
ncbi:unnamed protein product [Cochlearia groenlandica]